MIRDRGLAIFALLIVFGLLAGLVCRAYYVFVFLPTYHAALDEPMPHLIEWNGWLAFITSPAGVMLNLAWIAPLVMALALPILLARSRMAE